MKVINRKILLVYFCSVIILFFVISVIAWFPSTERTAHVTPAEVDRPPTINIINNETTELDILNLDGLVIGENYNIVFCVTPNSPGSVEYFDLELAYTQNLSEDINLYTCEYVGTSSGGDTTLISKQSKEDPNLFYYYRKGTALSPSSITTGKGYTANELANSVQASNVVKYQLYHGFNALKFDRYIEGQWTEDWSNNRSRYLFFLLEISWPSDFTANIDSKETDMVCVTANGITIGLDR